MRDNPFLLRASVIIPVYNEAGRLAATLRQLAAGIEKQDLLPLAVREVLIVDDGSTDESAAIARGFLSSLPNLRIIRSGGNFGKGHAVRAGLAEALEDWALVADADMSTPWPQAARLARIALQESSGVVFGSRHLPQSDITRRQEPFRERMGRFFNRYVRALTKLPFEDTQCGFKLIQRASIMPFFSSLKVDRFAWDVEFLVACRRSGVKTVEAPVQWANDEDSRVRMFHDGWDMAWSVFLVALQDGELGWLFAAASFFIPLAAYMLTLAPSVYWQDSGIYLAAAKEFGIPYATGYPLYVIMTFLAGLIPLGTFAQRVHTVSALAGAGACLAVYLTVIRFWDKPGERQPGMAERFLALVIALGTGFSFALWCQAVNSEVYSLHACFIALLLYFLLKLQEDPASSAPILPIAVVSGLGFANHPMIAGILPVLAYAIWMRRDQARAWLKAFPIGVLVALLPYSYFPIRSRYDPLTDWGDPETLPNFLKLVAAAHWTANPGSYSLFGMDFWRRVVDLFRLFFLNFGPVAIPLGLVGGASLWRRKRFFFGCLAISTGVATILPLLYHQTGEFESWFVAAYIGFSLAVGEGAFEALRFVRARWTDRRLPSAFVLALAAAYPAFLLYIALPTVDRSRDWDAHDYGENILNSVGPHALFFISGDNPSSTVLYLQGALNERRDVAAVNVDALWVPWYRDHVRKNLHLNWGPLRPMTTAETPTVGDYALAIMKGNPDRPAYVLVPSHVEDLRQMQFSPSGMVFRMAQTRVEEPASRWDFKFHDPEALTRKRPADQRRLINQILDERRQGFLRAYSTGADEFMGRHDFQKAAELYAKAIALAPWRADLRLRLGVSLAQWGDLKASRDVFADLVRLFPKDYQAYYNLGNVLIGMGDQEGARKAYLAALQIEPRFDLARQALEGK